MKNTLIVITITCLLLSCTNSPDHKSEAVSESSVAKMSQQKMLSSGDCFRFERNGDIVEFKIVSAEDTIVAGLSYALFEKDKNTGQFKGVYKDSLLTGNYNFMSEGQQSSRDVVFKVTDSTLREGYGNSKTIGNTVRFVDVNTLKFDSNLILKKVDCAD